MSDGVRCGTRTIGVAVSDALGLTAQGVEVIQRRDLARDLSACASYGCLEVEGFVVGIPRNMNGTYGPAAEEARRFGEIIREQLQKPVFEEDERLTTVAAESLIDADLSRRRRRQVVDKVAATLILETFRSSSK